MSRADLPSDPRDERGLPDLAADHSRPLQRELKRRHRAGGVLTGAAVLALIVGAAALTAAKPEASAVTAPVLSTASTPEAEPTPTSFEQPDFSADQLTAVGEVSGLDTDARWRTSDTSADFGRTTPLHSCLTATPTDPRAEHLWWREHVTQGAAQPTTATEVLEVSTNADRAAQSYDRLVTGLATCPGGGFEVADYAEVSGTGAEAALLRLQHAERTQLSTEKLAVVRTGRAVVTWLVQAPERSPVADSRLAGLMAQSTNEICGYADGPCVFPDPRITSTTPPAAGGSRGLLGPADLPVLAGLPDSWVATDPEKPQGNPAATECDQADFAGTGATGLRARSFVVPTAERVATIFGMTQVAGEFSDVAEARSFVREVTRDIATCNNRQPSVDAGPAHELSLERGSGSVWQIEVGTSEQRALAFRMALVQVGGTVSQLSFTPSDRFDLSDRAYAELADRAAQRLPAA